MPRPHLETQADEQATSESAGATVYFERFIAMRVRLPIQAPVSLNTAESTAQVRAEACGLASVSEKVMEPSQSSRLPSIEADAGSDGFESRDRIIGIARYAIGEQRSCQVAPPRHWQNLRRTGVYRTYGEYRTSSRRPFNVTLSSSGRIEKPWPHRRAETAPGVDQRGRERSGPGRAKDSNWN